MSHICRAHVSASSLLLWCTKSVGVRILVNRDDKSDLLLQGLYQSRHTHTHCSGCPTEAVWLCKKQVEYRSLRV